MEIIYVKWVEWLGDILEHENYLNLARIVASSASILEIMANSDSSTAQMPWLTRFQVIWLRRTALS